MSSGTGPLFRTDTCGLRFDPERLAEAQTRVSYQREEKGRKKKTAPARGLEKYLELKRSERCRYCFGGVLAGALVVGLLAGDVAGFAGLGATLPAAGAATPD